MKKSLWLYAVDPVDYFDGAIKLDDFLLRDSELGELDLLWKGMQRAAKHSYWEGDVVAGPYAFFIPTGNCGPDFGFIWKQCSNGSTFVASPIRIPWLDEYEVNGHAPSDL